MAWKGVITNAGQSLLTQLAAGGHTLHIATAQAGSGLTPEVNLRSATALKTYVTDASIAHNSVSEGKVTLKVQLTPIETAFTAREVGLFGYLDSDSASPVLFSLHQDTAGGVAIPAASESPDFVFGLNIVLALSNTEDLEITIDPTAFVSASAFAAAEERITALEEAMPGAATEDEDGWMSASDKTKLDGIAEGANNYTHPSYTARTGVPTANQTPGFGGTFSVNQVVSDATGHVTAATSRTVKIPSTAATTSAAGLMSAADKTKLDGLNVYVPFLGTTNRTFLAEGTDLNTLTTPGTYYATDAVAETCTNCPVTTAFVLYVVNITSATYQQQILFKRSSVLRYTRYKASSTFGAWRSDAKATTETDGWMSKADKTKLDGIATGANAYTHPSYTARTGVPTANQTPGFGGTFSVNQVVSDATGHVTAATSRTITIPSTAATTSAAGLMSAADKTNVNTFSADSGNISLSAWNSTNTNADSSLGYYRKVGKTVIVWCYLANKVKFAVNTAKVVLTMPSGYRPNVTVRANCSRNDGGAVGNVHCDTDGKLYITAKGTDAAVGTEFTFEIVYFVA